MTMTTIILTTTAIKNDNNNYNIRLSQTHSEKRYPWYNSWFRLPRTTLGRRPPTCPAGVRSQERPPVRCSEPTHQVACWLMDIQSLLETRNQ